MARIAVESSKFVTAKSIPIGTCNKMVKSRARTIPHIGIPVGHTLTEIHARVKDVARMARYHQ
jgi:hypothetical protein